MAIVSNSSTLISLAKIGRLGLLNKLRKDIKAPKIVYDETVKQGKEQNLIDATKIEELFDKEIIKCEEVDKKLIENLKEKIGRNLGEGDYHVLVLAKKERVSEILTDDLTLATIMQIQGFQPLSSSDLLLEALGKRLIILKEFNSAIRNLVIEKRLSYKEAEKYMMEGEKYAEY